MVSTGPASPDPVERVIGQDRETVEAEARRALYATGSPIIAPGGIPPRWGCSLVAHEKLGWCGACRGITVHVEALGWRVWATGQPQNVDWARAVTREVGPPRVSCPAGTSCWALDR